MTTVPEHIKNLLFEQDCVVIPDFGGFIANFHSAALHANGSILPPRRRLAFNEVLKFDDGLLSSYVASKENCLREDALQRIKAFSEHLKTELRRKNQCGFGQLGSFTLNREGKLVFEPDDRLNFHPESYGFVPVFPKFSRKYQAEAGVISLPVSRAEIPREPSPILEPEVEEVPVLELSPKSVRRTSWTSVAAACAVLAISVVGYQFIQSDSAVMSSFNPVEGFNFTWLNAEKAAEPSKSGPTVQSVQKAKQVAAVSVTPKADHLPATVAPVPATTQSLQHIVPDVTNEIKRSGTRFYVVVGGFKKPITANKLKRELIAKGFQGASLVMPKRRGMIKVSAENFETSVQANELARQIGKQFGAPAWVLKQ